MARKKVFQISDALTEGLEDTITAAHTYSGELRVDVIPIKKIEVDPENPRDLALSFSDVYIGISESDEQLERKTSELEGLQTIANSIRDQGIINPIVVYKYGEKYRLVAGERRTLGSILAGKSEIQAKILESKPSELRISLLQWIENVERADLTLWERLRNLEKIVQMYAAKKGVSQEQVTITELSNLIGCTKPHAMNYKAVLIADDEIKQLIRENKIKNLEKAALIANIQSHEVKQHAIDNCLAGATLKKLKVIAEQEQRRVITSKAIKMPSTRGRQAISVNLGVTKNIKVAKLILEALLDNHILSPITQQFVNVDYRDYKSITDTFRELLKKLEAIHA